MSFAINIYSKLRIESKVEYHFEYYLIFDALNPNSNLPQQKPKANRMGLQSDNSLHILFQTIDLPLTS